MSWPWPMSSASVGTAKPGVPMKASRSATLSGVSETLCLLQFAQRHGALQLRQVIDEEDAFEMVHLVLQVGCEQPVGFDRVMLAVAVEILGLDARGPLHVVPYLG